MTDGRLRGWLARQFDDYVEETAVGHRAWVIVLLFGVGLPVLTFLLVVLFPSLYRPGNVPISLLIGMVIGLVLVLVARERERYRAAAIDHTGDIAALRKKSWGEFEILVGEVFRRQGYVVKERGGFKRDFGVDLIAERGKERVIIQCKHWLVRRVHEGPVKELYADVKSQGFAEGWLVTCGRFTDPARSWAHGKEIRLIDGEALVELIQPAEVSVHPQAPIAVIAKDAKAPPSCPNCATPMHRLTNRFDQSRFWGCPNPVCGGTFDDPPADKGTPRCGHGHRMVTRKSERGVEFWGCADPGCSRKRLLSL
jgi:restriction system protein